jgi:two-component system, chemotaxis family, protein-glutamate methylesterase/glutaminase
MVSAILSGVAPALTRSMAAVVVGGSQGAVEALCALLPSVCAATDVATIVVVHMLSGRPSLLPELFAPRLRAPVKEASDKDSVQGGIWFAPPDYHLLVERDRTFSLSVDPPVNFSRPSIDVLFESAAEAYGERLLAVVLTGANADGAAGARAVREAGGVVVVQDPRGAEASRMPLAAIERADPQWVASLDDIAALIHAVTGDSP